MMRRYLLPPDLDASSLAESLDTRCELVVGPRQTLTVTYLDTFDWRLHRAGYVLAEERGRERRLALHEPGREPYTVPSGSLPTLPGDLPEGHLAERVGPLLGIRALAAVGTTRVERRDGRIQDDGGDLVARLRIEETEPLDADGLTTDRLVTVSLDDGAAAAALTRSVGLEPAPDHDLEAAAAARGRLPGDYSSKLDIPLEPGRRSDLALIEILLDLLATLEANVDGTIADHDTEFLHDLRVAARRTRSALSQLRGVLPGELTRPFNAELKWLGGVTGPLRDLDVYLLEMPVYRSMLPDHAAADLEPLEGLIGAARRRAHRTVVRALGSARFADLVTGWRSTLETFAPLDDPIAERPVAALAGERIAKAYRRILKKGRRLDDDPPAEALHRLRIDAKKLRYLLEFFKNLYPADAIAGRIKELKRLQDILGGFNDMEVQRHRLEEFAEALHQEAAVDASTLLTLGRLAGTLEQRQEAFRLAFHDAFAEFSSRPVRDAYAELSNGRDRS
jgi:CHAD domain-containing protein